MTHTDQLPVEYHIAQIKKTGRFVFAYHITPEEKILPQDQLRAKLKVHMDRCLDAFFMNAPKARATFKNHLEHY